MVAMAAFELDLVTNFMDLAIDAGAQKTFAAGAFEQGFVARVLARFDGGQHQNAATFGHL